MARRKDSPQKAAMREMMREKKNQRIFVHIKCSASPMDFPDCKYDHKDADFQDEAIWDVIWLADK